MKKLILMATLTTVMVTATTPVALAQMEEPLSYVGYITTISGNSVLVEEDPQDPVLGGAGTNKGYFIPPTIYAGVDPKARIAQEEIFGPLLFSCPLSLFTVFPRRPLLGSSVNKHTSTSRVDLFLRDVYLHRRTQLPDLGNRQALRKRASKAT